VLIVTILTQVSLWCVAQNLDNYNPITAQLSPIIAP